MTPTWYDGSARFLVAPGHKGINCVTLQGNIGKKVGPKNLNRKKNRFLENCGLRCQIFKTKKNTFKKNKSSVHNIQSETKLVPLFTLQITKIVKFSNFSSNVAIRYNI